MIYLNYRHLITMTNIIMLRKPNTDGAMKSTSPLNKAKYH
jgi:hypothetical protein